MSDSKPSETVAASIRVMIVGAGSKTAVAIDTGDGKGWKIVNTNIFGEKTVETIPL